MRMINRYWYFCRKWPEILRIRYRWVKIFCPNRPPDWKSPQTELWFEEMIGLSNLGVKFNITGNAHGVWNKDDGPLWRDWAGAHHQANRAYVEYINAKLQKTLLE